MSARIGQNARYVLRNWLPHAGVFALACVAVIARRPSSVFNAQFYAEDGRVFFQEAYNFGWWSALIRPYGGYFHAVPRLGAALALYVPLSFAPLVLNIIAIAGQALPVNLLLSNGSAQWGSLRYRCLLAATYLALPNLSELGTNITNVQCFLALSAFLLLAAATPRTHVGQTFDLLFLLLFGMSGPYCILLLPIAVSQAWKHRDRWKSMQAAVLAGTTVVEACSLLIFDHASRPRYALSAHSAVWLIRILGGQVYLGVLIGTNTLASMGGQGILLVLAVAAICCSALVAICAAKASEEMRLFLIFSLFVLTASLVSPMLPIRPGQSLWESMAGAWGSHYWFFPNLAFAWTLVWCFHTRPAIVRIIAGYLLFFMTIAILRNFRQFALKDMNFQDHVKQFAAAPSGQKVCIPINPDDWSMWLIKH